MTVYEIISIIIAGISALVAVLSFVFSFITKKKYDLLINSEMRIKSNSGVAIRTNNGDVNVKQ